MRDKGDAEDVEYNIREYQVLSTEYQVLSTEYQVLSIKYLDLI